MTGDSCRSRRSSSTLLRVPTLFRDSKIRTSKDLYKDLFIKNQDLIGSLNCLLALFTYDQTVS